MKRNALQELVHVMGQVDEMRDKALSAGESSEADQLTVTSSVLTSRALGEVKRLLHEAILRQLEDGGEKDRLEGSKPGTDACTEADASTEQCRHGNDADTCDRCLFAWQAKYGGA